MYSQQCSTQCRFSSVVPNVFLGVSKIVFHQFQHPFHAVRCEQQMWRTPPPMITTLTRLATNYSIDWYPHGLKFICVGPTIAVEISTRQRLLKEYERFLYLNYELRMIYVKLQTYFAGWNEVRRCVDLAYYEQPKREHIYKLKKTSSGFDLEDFVVAHMTWRCKRRVTRATSIARITDPSWTRAGSTLRLQKKSQNPKLQNLWSFCVIQHWKNFKSISEVDRSLHNTLLFSFIFRHFSFYVFLFFSLIFFIEHVSYFRLIRRV